MPNSVTASAIALSRQRFQRAELIDGERGIEFNGEVCDGLAKVAVVVHHLVDGIAELQQLFSVRSGTQAHFGQGGCVTSSCS